MPTRRPTTTTSRSTTRGGVQHGTGQHQPNIPQQQQQQGSAHSSQTPASIRLGLPPYLFFDSVCVMWNLGKCLKAPGACTSRKGDQLKHVCNHRPNPSRPDVFCGKDHPPSSSISSNNKCVNSQGQYMRCFMCSCIYEYAC